MTTWARFTVSAARGAVQRINDRSLEYVIVLLRAVALLCTLIGWTPTALAWIWSGDWRWGATLAVEVVVGCASCWLGFWFFGNKEWFRGDPT